MKTSRNTRPSPYGDRSEGRRKGSGGGHSKRVFTEKMRGKLAITAIVITLALFALIWVLYRIVKENNDQYSKIVLSQRQQEFSSRTLPYRRGDIVDRNGTLLATSEKVYNLILDPQQIMKKPEYYLEPTIQALTDCFGFDSGEIRSLIQEKSDRAYVPYKKGKQLSYDQKVAFETMRKERNAAYYASEEESQSRLRIMGVWFEDQYRRVYPYGSAACNVIGFSSADGTVGTGGIEQFYNEDLVGVNGREYGYLDEENNLEGVLKEPSNGKTIVSTIDLNIQNILQKYIDEWQTTVGSHVTAAIAMNPKNGEILGMATSTKFDLNDPRKIEGYSDDQLYELGKKDAVSVYKREHPDTSLTEEQMVADTPRENVISYGRQVVWNQIWRNFCVSDTYEPGSPSKILTVAAGLEEGVLKGNEYFDCEGLLNVGGWPIKCTAYVRGGHGSLSLQESIMQSCNVAMMRIGAMMGRDNFAKYQSIFGMGQKTGVDLPGEADAAGLIYSAENMGSTELATNAFGQNYNCTMIQMAAALCSVINGGSYYEPHVMRQILNEQGSVVESKAPVLVRETVSASTSEFLKEAMFQTVENGTGGAARVEGYSIGGKTGTAEKQPRSAKNYLLSFAGFAPAEDPQLFVYVVVDVPNYPPGPQQAHSSFASGIFAKIMAEALPYMNVFPEAGTQEAPGSALAGQEGINEPSSPEEETAEETKAEESEKDYETDEYVDEGFESGLPDAVPADPNASSAAVPSLGSEEKSGQKAEGHQEETKASNVPEEETAASAENRRE